MKKKMIVLSVFVMLLAFFTACSDKKNEEETTTVSTTVMGDVANSYIHIQGEGQTVVYETDKKETLKMDIYDKDGNLKYTEEYLYDEYGEVYGYAYYDKDSKFVAKYISKGENRGFFNQDDTVMSEAEFSKKMDAIGVYDY